MSYYGNRGFNCNNGVGVSIFVIICVILIGMCIAKRRSRPFTPMIRPGMGGGQYMGPPPQQPPAPGYGGGMDQPYHTGPPQGGYQPPPGPPPSGGYQPPSGPPPSGGYQPPSGAPPTDGKFQPPSGPPPASYQPSK
ncbi:uncharacterized protein MJAP1_002898 [Malassezia japonica]|uniref:Uncharacterized protein n=1 Tax=Malassezia japonica TaxID=223818 RepID=A0AAF0JGF3_9BASI|nr:uncharacterized protein MJAP1_002898 [Malassezia japonica]WFD39916.1 hypothetical protein MJAP1_002898 [Malassezia japonica]